MARQNTYYEEVICSGLGRYIQKEYLKAMYELGDVPHQSIHEMGWEDVSLRTFLVTCAQDAPLVSFKLVPFSL